MNNNISLKELYLTYPVESLFHTLTKDLVVKIDENKYPNRIFYFNNHKIIFEHNTINDYFYCSYFNFNQYFYEKFNINWLMLSKIVKDMVENHFKLSGITPPVFYCKTVMEVENHFKLSGITPLHRCVHF